MATTDQPPNDPGVSDSDRQWFDRLSGKPGPYSDEQAVLEADALALALRLESEALAADPAFQASTSPAGLEQQWQRLEAELHRQDLLETPPSAAAAAPAEPPVRPPKAAPVISAWGRLWAGGQAALAGWQRWPAAAGAMAVLVLAVVLVQQGPEPIYSPEPEWRGADGLLQRKVAQPRQDAEAFAQALRAAGLRPGLYQRRHTYIVDINLQADELAAAAPIFAPLALPARVGTTRVEFLPE